MEPDPIRSVGHTRRYVCFTKVPAEDSGPSDVLVLHRFCDEPRHVRSDGTDVSASLRGLGPAWASNPKYLRIRAKFFETPSLQTDHCSRKDNSVRFANHQTKDCSLSFRTNKCLRRNRSQSPKNPRLLKPSKLLTVFFVPHFRVIILGVKTWPHTALWTLNTAPWTLNSGPWTLDPGPWTLDPGPWTLDPGPWTLDPGPWTPDPGPWTRLPIRGSRG